MFTKPRGDTSAYPNSVTTLSDHNSKILCISSKKSGNLDFLYTFSISGEIIVYKYKNLDNGTLDFIKQTQINIFASNPYGTYNESLSDPIFKALIFEDN